MRFTTMANIFLLEDDKILSKGISIALKKDEHTVTAVYGYLEALQQYQKQKYDLFLLDINLPDGNGLEFCKKIRETSETPVLFLTANDTEEDMLEGFGVGCDDYISKPFSIEVLRKKVLAVLKRTGIGKFRMKYRDLELDKEKCVVLMKGQEIHLTSTEYKLLLYLMENRGRVVTKAMLLEQLWDIDGNFVDDNTVRVNIKRLRQKLHDEKQEYIVTVFGMCFNFHHLKVDYKDGNKWELMEPDYMELKVIFEKWQMGMQRGNAWNALFWCNHDQPRIVSRFGNEGEYWKESAKMLAGMIHLMRGTPYIYQGEEIGMTNPHYTSIEQYADVESRNYYEILLNEGKTKEEALEILAARSRDNSRTPMQWTDERYCGFSDTKPWIPVSDNFEKINVKKQKQDRDSILEFYKKLIMLRKEKEVIARGNIEFMEVENAGVLAYTRCLDKQKLLVCCNFRDVESQMEFTQEWKSGRKILGNYEENHKNNYKVLTLRPYEIIVLEKGEE